MSRCQCLVMHGPKDAPRPDQCEESAVVNVVVEDGMIFPACRGHLNRYNDGKIVLWAGHTVPIDLGGGVEL